MGITKTDGFSDKINHMADVLKAMGHPARLSIMQYLAASPSCICNDLVDELPLAQPTISRHLSELKRVGLIQGKISGKNICYCINPLALKMVSDLIRDMSDVSSTGVSCC